MRFSSIITVSVLLAMLFVDAPLMAQWRNVLKAPSYGMAWNPKNPKTIYVGGASRAVYRTFDGGDTWDTTYIEFVGASEEFLNVVVHPIDTAVVIVGGSRFGTIRRSTDCGKTWDIALRKDWNVAFLGESIIIDNSNPDFLYAADFNKGTIYRSSTRGATWDSLSTLPIETSVTPAYQQNPCSITQRSDSSNVLLVGCLRSTILKSEDTGRTWRRVTKLRSSKLDEPEIPQIHFSKTNPRVGYALTTYFFYGARPNGGMYKTTDGGETWNEFRFRDTSFWSMDSRPLPSGKGDEIVAGGFTEYFLADTIVPGSGSILRTLDNGDTWWNYKDRIPYFGEPDHSVITLRFVGDTYATQRLVAATVGGTCILEPEGLAGVERSELSNSRGMRLESAGGNIRVIDSYSGSDVRTFRVMDMLGRTIHGGYLHQHLQQFEGTIPQEVFTSGLFLVVITRSDGSSDAVTYTVVR